MYLGSGRIMSQDVHSQEGGTGGVQECSKGRKAEAKPSHQPAGLQERTNHPTRLCGPEQEPNCAAWGRCVKRDGISPLSALLLLQAQGDGRWNTHGTIDHITFIEHVNILLNT